MNSRLELGLIARAATLPGPRTIAGLDLQVAAGLYADVVTREHGVEEAEIDRAHLVRRAVWDRVRSTSKARRGPTSRVQVQ